MPCESTALLPTIVYLLGKLDRAGAEMRSLQLMEAIKRQHPEIRIAVYVVSRSKGHLDEDYERAGIELVHGPGRLRGMLAFWSTCRRYRATVAHVNVGMGSGYFAAAARFAGVEKRICHFRTEREYRSNPVSWLRGRLGVILMLLFATDIIGVCAAARHFPRIPARRWRTVYNGVASEDAPFALAKRARAREGESSNILVMGRLAPDKNYLRPISILETLAPRREAKPIRLHYVGTGSANQVARLKRGIAASPVADAILAHGLSEDPLAHLRRADVLLTTSLGEGLPGVVLEALSVGTPVVASDLAGIREIAAATEGVALVPLDAGDEQWADAILAATSADRARTIVDSFRRSPFRLEPYVNAIAEIWGLPAPAEAAERATA